MADWTKAYRGWGWRNITAHVATADGYETRLNDRLEGLAAIRLIHSDHFYLNLP